MNPYASKKGKTEWQWNYLTRDFVEDATNASTLRVKLPANEQLSAIELECRATMHATGYDWQNLIHDLVEKIEIIADGSKILYSQIPETAMFTHLHTMWTPPRLDYAVGVSKVNKIRVKIPFGRWLRDEDYMLDTGLYNNVYLEVPWALDITKWVTHTFQHTVRFLRPIQRLSPVGMVRTRDIEYGQHAWTATGEYLVELPLEYPWHTLGCRIFNLAESVVGNIPHIKLDIDDGRLVLVDDDLDDMQTDDTQYLPYPVHVHYRQNKTLLGATTYAQAMLGEVAELSGSQLDGSPGTLMWAGETGQQLAYDLKTAAAARIAGNVNLTAHGTMYFCNQIIKHWCGGEPFPAKSHSSARITYTHGARTITDLRTWLQELAPLKIP